MNPMTRYAALLPIAIAALLAAGCENSGLTAPTDGTIDVRANPATIVIDPNRLVESPPGSGIFVPESEGKATIVARLFDANGNALEGVSVFFSTNGGSLASLAGSGGAARAVKTNANGVAEDVLTVGLLGPTAIEVTAVSGALTGTATITKQIGDVNRPPVAAVVVTPRDEQGVGKPVLFDGSASTDPDDEPITMYRWTVNSSNADGVNPLVIEDAAANAFERSFVNVQSLSGTLQVTDDPLAPQKKARGEAISYRSTAVFSYRIVRVVCGDNRAPVAVIAGPDTIQLSAAFNQTVTVLLDGRLSSDPEGVVSQYIWNCGNRSTPQPPEGGARVSCSYVVEGTAKTYQATLAVKDDGTGAIDPVTGDYQCIKNSPEVSVNIVVSPTTLPGL